MMSYHWGDDASDGSNGTYATCKLLKIRDIRYGAGLAERAGSAFFCWLIIGSVCAILCVRHTSLFYSSVCQKLGFKMIYELSQQRVSLMNKSYRYVGYCLIRPYRYGLAEIGAVSMLLASHSCLHCLSAVDAQLFKISYFKIVFIINQKFLQTGFRNVCKLQFGLSPGAACCASLGNILLA